MSITPQEIAETRGMVSEHNLDIRTITMGISLMGCADDNLERMCTKVYDHVTRTAEHLVETAEGLEREYGIPIVNKRVAVTPVAQIASACSDEDLVPLAHALDRAAETLGIDYLGGYSALVHKGIGDADRRLMKCIPRALAETSRVCSSVNVATLRHIGESARQKVVRTKRMQLYTAEVRQPVKRKPNVTYAIKSTENSEHIIT